MNGFELPTRRALMGGLAAAATPGCAHVENDEATILTGAIADNTVPGMAAMIIRDFQAQRELVSGVRRIGTNDRVRRGDVWHLGSDGKAMTATLIASLVERGVLAWDARLDQMLPDLAGSMHPEYRDVTLPDLLSHRSGLPENIANLDVFYTYYDDPAPPTQQRLRYITAALADPPTVPKRRDNSYSNTGFLIAAAAAERATGEAFEALIVSRVFTPLRMRSVSFDQFGGVGEPVGHVEGRVADQPRDANPGMFAPAGGMRMTLQDWSRFCIDHLHGERGTGQLLRAETYRFLHTAQGETRSALGWGVQASAVGRRGPVLTHSGSDGNWYALVLLFPETGSGVLVAANAADSMGGDAASVAALRALAPSVAEPLAPTP